MTHTHTICFLLSPTLIYLWLSVFRYTYSPGGSRRDGLISSSFTPVCGGHTRFFMAIVLVLLSPPCLVLCRRWYAGSILAVTSHLTGKEGYFQLAWYRWM